MSSTIPDSWLNTRKGLTPNSCHYSLNSSLKPTLKRGQLPYFEWVFPVRRRLRFWVLTNLISLCKNLLKQSHIISVIINSPALSQLHDRFTKAGWTPNSMFCSWNASRNFSIETSSALLFRMSISCETKARLQFWVVTKTRRVLTSNLPKHFHFIMVILKSPALTYSRFTIALPQKWHDPYFTPFFIKSIDHFKFSSLLTI